MVKHFNVIMAGVISGIVALFTSVLGISGTIIGSVLSSFLYQLLSSYSQERYDERQGHSEEQEHERSIANEVVYIFPLVVIALIELIFMLSALHYRFDMIFSILESAVSNNLFRLMGIGLIILGAYPYYNSSNINKTNGTVVLIIGVLLLLRGLVDITPITANIFYAVFARFDFFFALAVVIILVLVIINILKGSKRDIFKSNDFINNHDPRKRVQSNGGPRKIDTSFNKYFSKKDDFRDKSNDNGNFNYKSHDMDDLKDNSYGNHDLDYNEPTHQRAVQNQENLPIYEEEIILVNNPDDPDHPIRKRILKRVKQANDSEDDGYQDMYIFDEQ